MITVYTQTGASGAVATSSGPLHTSPQLVQWVDWAHGVFVGVGLLVCCMIAVWLVRVLLHGAWYGLVGQESVTGSEVANAPPCACSNDSVPPLQKCNGGTKRCSVCELAQVVEAHDEAVRQLSVTRAILTEIMAQAALNRSKNE